MATDATVRRGTDENRYKYMHGGKYGDRDLYLIREQKYGPDPNYEERRYRPGYREQMSDYEPYANTREYHPEGYEVRETRPVAYRSEYDSLEDRNRDWNNDPLYRNRDNIISYGNVPSPSGGIRGIDYSHDLNRYPASATYSTGGTKRISRSVEYDNDRDYSNSRTIYGSGNTYSSSSGVRRSKSGRKKWTPVCDIGETEKYWVVRCEIPGVKKDKLSVEIEGKDLIIRGKRMKELWNSDRLNNSGSMTSSSVAAAPAPSGTTTTNKNESVVLSKDPLKPTDTSAQAGGVPTSGSTTVEKRNPDGSVSVTKISWVDKERGGRGTFKRKIRLPARVEQSAVQALYKDGILEVLVRKPEVVADKKKDKESNNRVAIN